MLTVALLLSDCCMLLSSLPHERVQQRTVEEPVPQIVKKTEKDSRGGRMHVNESNNGLLMCRCLRFLKNTIEEGRLPHHMHECNNGLLRCRCLRS